MLLFLLDIHRNILSVQSFVQCISNSIEKIQISLKSNGVCVEFYKDSTLFHCLNILMPNNFIQPCSVSSICCHDSKEYFHMLEDNVLKMHFPLCSSNQLTSDCEIPHIEATFRFQVGDNDVIDDCILKSGSQLHFKDFIQEKLEKYESYNIFCTSCNSLLTNDVITVKSVQKYYEGTSDSAETWFCHQHEGHQSAENTIDSLYISDMHFYFHDSILKFLLILEDNKCCKCINCLSTLSFKKKMNKPHYIGFFVDKIMLERSEIDTNTTRKQDIQKYKRDIALLAFTSVIQDLANFTDFCSLYLQCKVDDRTEVLLLQFNCQKVVQFLLHEENDENLPNEVEFKTKEVYKVLFSDCSPDSELSKKWKHDFNVDFFHISDNMMVVTRELLQKSLNYFPRNQKTNDGFSFGYLPALCLLSSISDFR